MQKTCPTILELLFGVVGREASRSQISGPGGSLPPSILNISGYPKAGQSRVMNWLQSSFLAAKEFKYTAWEAGKSMIGVGVEPTTFSVDKKACQRHTNVKETR